MDPCLFLSVLGLVISVTNGQMAHSQMGQMTLRRNFPRRQMRGGTGGGGGGAGGGGMDASMNGGNNAQRTGMRNQGQPQGMNGQGVNKNQNAGQGGGGGGGGGMQQSTMGNGGGGFGGMGGGMGFSSFMGGGSPWMRMNMAMNSELPPGIAMGGNFHTNFGQYRACEKTPSKFNHYCDPSNPNACPTSSALIANMRMFGGMFGMGMLGAGNGMGGAGNGMGGAANGMGGNGQQQQLFICTRMNEHGMARCCAKTMQSARMLDKMF